MNTQDLSLIWNTVRDTLREKLGETVFETWIAPLQCKNQSKETVTIEAPDIFFCEWIEKHYKLALSQAFGSVTKSQPSVLLEVSGQTPRPTIPAPETAPAPPESAFEPHERAGLNPRYTFDNFVIGPSNRHAHAYSLAVAESPAKSYNPLFIYGGVGLGKTHLMQAICHHIRQKNGPQTKICYTSSEKFMNELILAIKDRSTHEFRQKYRGLDVLVIDDVHFFAGREATQEEFFHTFNALYDEHKQIIMSSDRPPREIANLQDRLVSRFGWGLATDIQPPDMETRVAILKKKIEREPVQVPDDVLFFIAQLIRTNIRELEGALVRTIAYALLEEEPITLGLAKHVLKDLLKEPKKLITVDFIQRCVAEEFGISLYDLKTKRRTRTIVLPRQIAMYLSRELTDLSFPEIGGFFGGKDHTTVLHACNKIKEVVRTDEVLQRQIEHIITVIKQ